MLISEILRELTSNSVELLKKSKTILPEDHFFCLTALRILICIKH